MPGDDNVLGTAIEEALRKAEADQRWKAHLELHDLAARLRAEQTELRWTSHTRLHDAHEREHAQRAEAHAKEHSLEAVARDKAEAAVNQRLEGMNEVRAQLKDQALTFARVEVVQALTDRVIAIEKLDIKGEGKSLGQGAVIAAIVGSVSFAVAAIGLIVLVANLLTAKP